MTLDNTIRTRPIKTNTILDCVIPSIAFIYFAFKVQSTSIYYLILEILHRWHQLNIILMLSKCLKAIILCKHTKI